MKYKSISKNPLIVDGYGVVKEGEEVEKDMSGNLNFKLVEKVDKGKKKITSNKK